MIPVSQPDRAWDRYRMGFCFHRREIFSVNRPHPSFGIWCAPGVSYRSLRLNVSVLVYLEYEYNRSLVVLSIVIITQTVPTQ